MTLTQSRFNMDLRSHRAFLDDAEVFLTPKEWNVMLLLTSDPGKAYSWQEIAKLIGKKGTQQSDQQTARVWMNRLRHKLGGDMITTVWGYGYRFDG